ncbi:chemotaxis protein MotA [Ectothiorhodospira shaposhnikovii]|uniref:motility protein A n=1 Tax=Ectothiorhodospira shaposhnikovii TaxID=1054 RepID=UPI0019060951|nr:MotA/TolQ/ExbB proton channel family protein [Ectothiorhodospira shaposhnikovii]MBK1673433.1 chemotaxis protein MotA [Ectothiorhodospira shaposhnikovii]
MNPSTLLGMVGGVVLLASVIAFTSQDLGVFLNLPGLGIVVGGTIAATLLSYPLHEVVRVFRVFLLVLRNERYFFREDMEEIVEVSRLWFSGKLAAVDSRLDGIRNPFLRTGVQLVIDGTPMEDINDLLQWRMSQLRRREHAEAQIFRTMAMYAPAFGMLGTLIGLINMLLATDTNDFAVIAVNLGVALITTFYGLILANLVFKPIAIKLERRTEERMILMNMVLEGVTLMRKGRSPAYIRETLKSFMAHHQDDLRMKEERRDPASPKAGTARPR